MESKLLQKMFEHGRITEAIDKCVGKGINKAELRKLKTTEGQIQLYTDIITGKEFAPGHQAAIPKNDGSGENRIVYIGETIERFLCSLINDCLFELLPHMIHPSTKAYQKGLGTGSSVQEFAKAWGDNYGKYSVVKSDYHHYFDDIKKEKVFEFLNKIEDELGFERNTEPVINLLRRMYSNDLLFDVDGNLIEKWSGIRQGNATASFLADAILYDIDEYMSNKYPYYVRYSDDSIILCENPEEVKEDLHRLIEPYGVTINDKKFEVVKDTYVKFLGFNVNGYNITLSKSRWADIQKELYESCKNCHSMESAVNKVNKVLYKGNGKYSWGTSCLPIINVEKDIDTFNEWTMDLIRIAGINNNKKRQIRKSDVGFFGVEMNHKDYTLIRNKKGGSRVSTAMERIGKDIDGYLSIRCMINNLKTSRALYNSLVLQM